MKQAITVFLRSLPFIIVLLVLVEVKLTNELASVGKEVQKTTRAIEELRDENSQLAQFVASSSALLTVEAKARLLGFEEPSTKQHVTLTSNDLPVALGPTR